MFGTLAIVQARLGSTRCRGKVQRRLGRRPLLEHVVRRVTDAQRVDHVVVASGAVADNGPIRDLVPPDVPVFFGSEQDVLGRFAAVCRQFPCRGVVRVCADNPFIDPALIDRLALAAEQDPSADYISFANGAGRPVVLTAVGVYAEYVRTEALLRGAAEATNAADREHVTRYFYTRPDEFQVRLLPAPAELDRDDLRLTIDLEEDWRHAELLFESLDPERLDWRGVTQFLAGQPRLRQRMADLNRAHAKA